MADKRLIALQQKEKKTAADFGRLIVAQEINTISHYQNGDDLRKIFNETEFGSWRETATDRQFKSVLNIAAAADMLQKYERDIFYYKSLLESGIALQQSFLEECGTSERLMSIISKEPVALEEQEVNDAVSQYNSKERPKIELNSRLTNCLYTAVIPDICIDLKFPSADGMRDEWKEIFGSLDDLTRAIGDLNGASEFPVNHSATYWFDFWDCILPPYTSEPAEIEKYSEGSRDYLFQGTDAIKARFKEITGAEPSEEQFEIVYRILNYSARCDADVYLFGDEQQPQLSAFLKAFFEDEKMTFSAGDKTPFDAFYRTVLVHSLDLDVDELRESFPTVAAAADKVIDRTSERLANKTIADVQDDRAFQYFNLYFNQEDHIKAIENYIREKYNDDELIKRLHSNGYSIKVSDGRDLNPSVRVDKAFFVEKGLFKYTTSESKTEKMYMLHRNGFGNVLTALIWIYSFNAWIDAIADGLNFDYIRTGRIKIDEQLKQIDDLNAAREELFLSIDDCSIYETISRRDLLLELVEPNPTRELQPVIEGLYDAELQTIRKNPSSAAARRIYEGGTKTIYNALVKIESEFEVNHYGQKKRKFSSR